MKFNANIFSVITHGRMRVQGEVDRVIDGDSFVAHLLVLPGLELHGMHIRVEGINAPELSGKDGWLAKAAAEKLLPPGTRFVLETKAPDKYGRVLGYVILEHDNFGGLMIAQGHAEPYRP